MNPKNQKVIGFNFLWNKDSRCSFFAVTNQSLFLYKIKRDNSNLDLIKEIPSKTMEFCFESSKGILALVSPNGRVSVFYLYQPKGSKHYNGPCFDLSVDKGINRPMSSGPKCNNLLKFIVRLDCNQVQCFKIYESYYFIHLDNLNGRIYLYSIDIDKPVEAFKNYQTLPGLYGIGVSENLLILQSYNTQETLIYDIQSQIQDYLIKVNHSEYVYNSANFRKSAEFSMRIELNSDFYFVSEQVAVDLRSSSFKSLQIDPATLIENHPDDQKIILFLLRRENCKMKVLEKLKDSMMLKTPIKKLEIIFSTLASAYLTAKLENLKTFKKLNEDLQSIEITKSDFSPSIELKIDNGVTVLMQSDIYCYVFEPVYKAITDIKYFAESLFCFFHFFIQHGISVHVSIQFLFLKVLVKIQDFTRLQKLLENKFFTDTQDIALFLISISKTEKARKFPFCFILGIDMLKRLKLFELAAEELSYQCFAFEALEICTTKGINGNFVSHAIRNCDFDFETPL